MKLPSLISTQPYFQSAQVSSIFRTGESKSPTRGPVSLFSTHDSHPSSHVTPPLRAEYCLLYTVGPSVRLASSEDSYILDPRSRWPLLKSYMKDITLVFPRQTYPGTKYLPSGPLHTTGSNNQGWLNITTVALPSSPITLQYNVLRQRHSIRFEQRLPLLLGARP